MKFLSSLSVKEHINKTFGFENQADWVLWPPNTFAVTSEILSKSGSYRHVLHENWNRDYTKRGKWQQFIETESQIWKIEICIELQKAFNIVDSSFSNYNIEIESIRNKRETESSGYKKNLAEIIYSICAKLEEGITFEQLRLVNQEDLEASDEVSEFISDTIMLHCICDEASTGIGLVGINSGDGSIFNCIANLLLISTGNLSTFSKQICTILPKMRTPQTGLSLRSFSHHLSFHNTEVEIMWRMFPWANIQENTLNILAVCWPNKVASSFFVKEKETFKNVRYFKYSNTDDVSQKFNTSEVINSIKQYRNKGIERIHFLVFPEISLNATEWSSLLNELEESFNKSEIKRQIPVVLSGVRSASKKNPEFQTNELRIGYFFAGKWYVISQRKHHRWRLDENQLRQYNLTGILSTSRNWFEKIELSQRRLSIITPNGWLSLCPLICEDLAQLEPVSNVIRGIGPTILIALLADGPQNSTRWSARYASVFADDPGTSVFSLTSIGMLKKSRPLSKDNQKDDDFTIALWKDCVRGLKAIHHQSFSDSELNTFLLTVSAQYIEEFTADGRTDHTNASVIRFEGVEYLEENANPKSTKSSATAPKIKVSSWTDIKELSLGATLLDTLLEYADESYFKIIETIVDGAVKKDQNLEMENIGNGSNDFYSNMIEYIMECSVNPRLAGILTQDSADSTTEKNKSVLKEPLWPTTSFRVFLWYFQKIYSQAIKESQQTENLYEMIFELVKMKLDALENGYVIENDIYEFEKVNFPLRSYTEKNDEMFHRIYKSCLFQILILLHNKLEKFRRRSTSGSSIHAEMFEIKRKSKPIVEKSIGFFDEIENLLLKYGY